MFRPEDWFWLEARYGARPFVGDIVTGLSSESQVMTAAETGKDVRGKDASGAVITFLMEGEQVGFAEPQLSDLMQPRQRILVGIRLSWGCLFLFFSDRFFPGTLAANDGELEGGLIKMDG